MNLRRFLLLSLLTPVLSASLAQCQARMDWIPAGVEQLGRTAAFHTDFTFDRTMLQIAGAMSDETTRQAIAKLDGVSVHSYRYAAPDMYDPRQLDLVRKQYHDAGWQHLVSTEKGGSAGVPGYTEEPNGRTDLYIKFEHMNVTGMVVVLASPRYLNVIALSGSLSPLDLLHLRGHFGIPRFQGDNFAPAQDN